MHVEMEPALVFTMMAMIFVLLLMWIKDRPPTTGERPRHVDTTDGGSADNGYAKAALLALQKHADSITNISAVQISAQLYSNSLISVETFAMIATNSTINKYQILTVFHDLQSKIPVYSSAFAKFVDILRSYPEYEELAHDLQGTYHHQCATLNLPIPRTEVSSINDDDSNKDMTFAEKTSTKLVTLEAKLKAPPGCGFPYLNEVMLKFTRLCAIDQSSFTGMTISDHDSCVTLRFQVPTSSLPILESKITNSSYSFPDMKVSLVKILGKTVFKTDCGKNTLKKSKLCPFISELDAIGTNTVVCQHHGILQIKISRCTVVLHDGMICVGGGTTGKLKQDLCKVFIYDPYTGSVKSLQTKVKFFSLAVLNNKLTTVGGLDNQVASDKIYSWDVTTAQWNESCPPMLTARRSTTSITFGDYLIVIGGVSSDTVYTVVEVLDIPNQKWYTGTSLPECMYNVQAVVVGNNLYLLGGLSSSVLYCSLPTLIMGAVSMQHNLSQLWKKLASLPYRCSATTLLGRHLLAIGGHDEEATNMTDLIYSYSPERNHWERAGTLKNGRRNCAAVKMLDERVFVIGGADSPAYDDYCESVEVVCLQ